MDTVAISSIIVLLGICSLHFFAHRLYRSKYFLLTLLVWAANLVYIIVESWIEHFFNKDSFDTEIIIYFVSLFSTFLLFYASKKIKKIGNTFKYLEKIVIWILLILGGFVLSILLFARYPIIRFYFLELPGTIFSIYTLLLLSSKLRAISNIELLRLLNNKVESIIDFISLESKTEITAIKENLSLLERKPKKLVSIARKIFIYTFIFYGIMQILYLAKPYYGKTTFFQILFFVALILKVVNGAGIFFLILADVRYSEIAIRFQSSLYDLVKTFWNIEHGIRGPLSNINTDISIMKEKLQHDNFVFNKLENIEDNIGIIYKCTEELVAYKESREVYKLKSQVYNIIPIVKEAIETAKNKFPGKKIKIDLNQNKEVIYISGRKNRLLEAFTNLITNGIEACLRKPDNDNSARLEINCMENKRNSKATIVIKDYGEGISSEDIPRLAKYGFSTKDPDLYVNRGIGLFTANEYINKHDGSIKIESPNRAYTIFTVELPLFIKEKKEIK